MNKFSKRHGKSRMALNCCVGFLILASLSCSSSTRINNLYLRDYAESVSAACGTYFSALEEFAYNSSDPASTTALGDAFEALQNSLLEMNSGIVLADESKSHPENWDNLNKITKKDKTEAEVQEFLTEIIQEQCAKWKAFALYTDLEIENYFLNDATSTTGSTIEFCQAAEDEASKIIISKNVVIKKCSAQQATEESKPALVLELNAWFDWYDPNFPPTGSEIDKYIFDMPLQLLVEGLRNSNVNPLDYESILIVSWEGTKSVYEFKPIDLKLALEDTRNLDDVLLNLREKMFITG
jgi:hypothetical protein